MKKCLIVDDVDVTLFATKKVLSSVGIEFVCVKTPDEALSTLQQGDFDLVFLDWHLGKLSGIDVLKAIREQHGHKHRVVICSAIEGGDKAAEALAAGADAFLVKPTTPDKVKQCLQDLHIL